MTICKFLFFYFTSCIFIFSSCQEQNLPLVVKHVYCLNPQYKDDEYNLKHDFYYVYNYKDSDSLFILKTLDTITIDSSQRYHTINFYKYDSNMPDTIGLAKMMKDPNHSGTSEPGYKKFNKNRIVSMIYVKSQIYNSWRFPGHYTIRKYNGDRESETYYLRKGAGEKFIEVPSYLFSETYQDLVNE